MRPRSRTRPRARGPAGGPGRPGRGFTLIELLVVISIIGILLAFIMTAAMDGVRRAEERATQALITKLEAGMSDRVDAILSTRADALPSHTYLAGVWVASTGWVAQPPHNAGAQPNPIANNIRAQILARFDQVKAELPDVFVVQSDASYPLNFAAAAFPLGTEVITNYGRWLLPMGVGVVNDPAGVGAGGTSFGGNPATTFPYTPTGDPTTPFAQIPPNNPQSTGIFGASYTAAAGVYKSLFESVQRLNPGLGAPTPKNAGYDGVDNNNNGLVDEITENDIGLTRGTYSSKMIALLANHTHKTARSESLYALLVEGQGPFGSVFSRDDFSDSEVKDTDGDGLPEFVDAWGEPLQFYRWPVFYQSDVQRGPGVYGKFETRDQNTLDANQSLVDPAWWGSTNNANSPFGTAASGLSGSAIFFESAFHTVADPNTASSLGTNAVPYPASNPRSFAWDRGSSSSPFLGRREYYSRSLILSGGPDKIPGVPVLDASYFTALGLTYSGNLVGRGGSGTFTLDNLRVESQAAPATPGRAGPYYEFSAVFPAPINGVPGTPTGDTFSGTIQEAGNDDVTNHNLNGPGGATQ